MVDLKSEVYFNYLFKNMHLYSAKNRTHSALKKLLKKVKFIVQLFPKTLVNVEKIYNIALSSVCDIHL